jgi:mono/diheme cytochrome c family protein
MERGRERYGIYCAPCHGLTGAGDGMITKRADELVATGRGKGMAWVPSTNVNQDHLRAQPVGQLFESISKGVRTMPAYGSQISVEDRWAIVLYLRALQRKTQGAP